MRVFYTLLMALSLLLTACSQTPPPKTMVQVDLKRYMGTWYEIASLPAPFQKNCYCTKAEYQLQADKVSVLNSCRKDSPTGQLRRAHATATAYPNSGNSRLKVTFFWPFSADYYILYVSPDYQTAVVGTPNRKFLWILARAPKINEAEYQQLVALAQQRGYSLEHLHKTVQC